MIPKILHVVWVGDESKRPDNCIQTWREHNPDWRVQVWGNAELAEYGWINARHMRDMQHRELSGLADLMRWEILYHEGGCQGSPNFPQSWSFKFPHPVEKSCRRVTGRGRP